MDEEESDTQNSEEYYSSPFAKLGLEEYRRNRAPVLEEKDKQSLTYIVLTLFTLSFILYLFYLIVTSKFLLGH